VIDFVEGTLALKSPSSAVVKSGGMGIRAMISLTTYDDLPVVGADVKLWTVVQIRDEEISVFGFSTLEERWLFQHLVTVNGVGPKLAITVLSASRPEMIRRAVVEGDSDRLKTIPRIGSKIADRIVLELKKKLGEVQPEFAAPGTGGPASDIRSAVEALTALGFSRAEAEKAVEHARQRGAVSVEELIKLSLRTG
jgi:holliday junction DNA helicase RuvA